MIRTFLAFSAMFLAIFLIGGGLTLVNAMLGMKIPSRMVKQVLASPYAILLYALGTFGLLLIVQKSGQLKENSPRKEFWTHLILGILLGLLLLFLANMLLEYLMIKTYI